MGAPVPYRDDLARLGAPPQWREYLDKPHEWKGVNISPTARIEAFASVDQGVRRTTRIGPHAWLMKGAHVGHDCIVGRGCELAPSVTLAGFVELGDYVFVGMNASIRTGVLVGTYSIIGQGAVVVSNVGSYTVVVGNPARWLRDVTNEEVKKMLNSDPAYRPVEVE
jgi:UDP-N-acetylglucosamine acyltransferase